MKFLEFQRRNKQKARQNRQNRQNRRQKPAVQGVFPDFNEHDTGRNLPKWMQDEIERIQAKQAAGEELEENDQKNLTGLSSSYSVKILHHIFLKFYFRASTACRPRRF